MALLWVVVVRLPTTCTPITMVRKQAPRLALVLKRCRLRRPPSRALRSWFET